MAWPQLLSSTLTKWQLRAVDHLRGPRPVLIEKTFNKHNYECGIRPRWAPRSLLCHRCTGEVEKVLAAWETDISGFPQRGPSITGLIAFCWGNKTSFLLLPSPNVSILPPGVTHRPPPLVRLNFWLTGAYMKPTGHWWMLPWVSLSCVPQQRHLLSLLWHTSPWGMDRSKFTSPVCKIYIATVNLKTIIASCPKRGEKSKTWLGVKESFISFINLWKAELAITINVHYLLYIMSTKRDANRPDSVRGVTTWAQEHVQNSAGQSHVNEKLYWNVIQIRLWANAHLKGSVTPKWWYVVNSCLWDGKVPSMQKEVFRDGPADFSRTKLNAASIHGRGAQVMTWPAGS